MDDQLLKPIEVAESFKISPAMIYKLLQRGDIPSIRIGSLVRVQRRDLEKYILENRSRNAPDWLPKI